MEKETKYITLVGVFIMSLTIAAILNGKIASFFGIFAPAGAITFPITFLITDVISEVWGKKRAHQVVWIGFFTIILATLFTYIAILLPSAPFWENQEAFTKTLSIMGRIVFGGLIAYLIAQHYDVWVFHALKKATNNKYLWLRNNLSTISSQFLNTIIFVILVFYGTLPTAALIPTIFGHFIIKTIFAIIDTPFAYALVAWAKK